MLSDRPRPQAPLTPDQRDAIRQQMRGLSGGARSRAAQSGRWLPIGALLDRLSRLPGVTAAAATDAAPFTAAQSRTARVRAEGRPAAESQPVPWHFVSDRYFDALGMSVVRGRVFADGDRVAPDERVVISAGLERRVFGGEPAVGRTLRLGENPLDVVTVIGVVADIRQRAFTDEDRLAMYALVWRDSARHLVVRASGDISALLPAIRQTVEHDDARLVVTSVEPLDGVVARSIVVERSRALLSGAYGLAALLLASVGLYGLAARLVAERRREIGIRVALGAGRRDVRRLVMIDAWLIVGVGLLIGVPSAIGLSRVAQGLLYDVAPTSPRTLILAAGTLAMAALASTLVPALRASRIDPAASLRED